MEHLNLFLGHNRRLRSLKLTDSSHLKMDGWNTIVSFLGPGALYSGAIISKGILELPVQLARKSHHFAAAFFPPPRKPSNPKCPLRPWEFLHSLRGAIGWPFQAPPFRQLNGIFCGSEPPRKLGKNMKKSSPKSAEGLELVVMYGSFLLLMGWKSWHKWRKFRYLGLAEVNH